MERLLLLLQRNTIFTRSFINSQTKNKKQYKKNEVERITLHSVHRNSFRSVYYIK